MTCIVLPISNSPCFDYFHEIHVLNREDEGQRRELDASKTRRR